MIASRATSVVTCRTPGMVTDRNLCHHDAPSTSAASYSSFGTFCKAARYSRMKNPICFHVTNIAIDGIAQVWLTSQDGCGASGPSTLSTIPPVPNMNSHTPTIATLAVTYGQPLPERHPEKRVFHQALRELAFDLMSLEVVI